MMPFHGCYLSFHGFSDEEKKHMEESTEQQGMFLVMLLCYPLNSQPKTAETYQEDSPSSNETHQFWGLRDLLNIKQAVLPEEGKCAPSAPSVFTTDELHFLTG